MKVSIKKLLVNVLKAFSSEVSFTLTQNASGDGWSKGTYNPLTRIVRIEALLYNGDASLSTNSPYFTVPVEYRPSTTIIIPVFVQDRSLVYQGYHGRIRASGEITQDFTGVSRGIWLQAEYRI